MKKKDIYSYIALGLFLLDMVGLGATVEGSLVLGIIMLSLCSVGFVVFILLAVQEDKKEDKVKPKIDTSTINKPNTRTHNNKNKSFTMEELEFFDMMDDD